MVDHAALSNSELHEPKGVASATDYTVYVADGAGSGAWERLIEEATAVSVSGTSTTVTGLGDYAWVYIMVPEIASSSGTNHDLTLRVGNAGGLTSTAVYYNYTWDYANNYTNSAGTSWEVGRTFETFSTNATYGQSYTLITISNFNKTYYSTMGITSNMDRGQTTNCLARQGSGFIREQKAYDRITLYDSYTFGAGDILVTGVKG